MKTKRKGAITALPDMLFIIIAIVVGIILLSMTQKLAPKNEIVDNEIRGDAHFVAETLARFATECWEKNKGVMGTKSDVCRTFRINASQDITEREFNSFLRCNTLPNNFLNVENTSDDCGYEDRVYWEIFRRNTEAKITFSKNRKRIEIVETGNACIGDCCRVRCADRCQEALEGCEDTCAMCIVNPSPSCTNFCSYCMTTATNMCINCHALC